MKKNLNIKELKESRWPGLLQKTFGDNLVSAFLHGDCLMEGFDALRSPWTVSFILKDNSPAGITPIQDLVKDARRENIQFCYFFSPAEIVKSLDTFPLEYLHISHKSEALCGIQPLSGYEPDRCALRLECERELRGKLIHMRLDSINGKLETDKVTETLLPTLYGVYFLRTGNYPENHGQVLEMFPGLREKDKNNYIASVTKIMNDVDSMEVK